ncbi:MAG: hypothetical protein RPU42_11165 [Candidatus Sedimenticola sp. (ex Thyasira tokunagai)]
MSYSVNWLTKAIEIPLADLTFLSGSNYTIDMADVHSEIRRLEGAFDEGLWAPQVLQHVDTVVLGGDPYSSFEIFINGYTVQFEAGAYNVSITGANTNILDVLIPVGGVSVALKLSGGKIQTGSGVTEQDKTDIINGTKDAILGAESYP